jgi:hypothetical protein
MPLCGSGLGRCKPRVTLVVKSRQSSACTARPRKARRGLRGAALLLAAAAHDEDDDEDDNNNRDNNNGDLRSEPKEAQEQRAPAIPPALPYRASWCGPPTVLVACVCVIRLWGKAGVHQQPRPESDGTTDGCVNGVTVEGGSCNAPAVCMRLRRVRDTRSGSPSRVRRLPVRLSTPVGWFRADRVLAIIVSAPVTRVDLASVRGAFAPSARIACERAAVWDAEDLRIATRLRSVSRAMGVAAVGSLRVDRQRGLATQACQHHVFRTNAASSGREVTGRAARHTAAMRSERAESIL